MFEDDVMTYVLGMLAVELAARPTPAVDPLKVDTYLARSVMQKAIRRGMTELALRAAAQLLTTDSRVLWRRLLVTALEDLGPGEADTTARIAFAYRDRAWRQTNGGDWPVIAELVMQACERTRCQSANDLWNVAKNDPGLDAFKAGLCDASLDDLLAVIVDPSRDIRERGAAILIAIGENAGPVAPDHIRSDVGAVFNAFTRLGQFGPVVVAYQEAFRKTRLALAPLSLCFWPNTAFETEDAKDDELPPVGWVGDIPTFSWDQYVAKGKAAVRKFAQQDDQWRLFARHWSIPTEVHVAGAGELLFRAEGARVTRRRQWPAGLDIYRRSRPLGCYMPADAVEEGMTLILRKLPHLDALRSGHLTTPS